MAVGKAVSGAASGAAAGAGLGSIVPGVGTAIGGAVGGIVGGIGGLFDNSDSQAQQAMAQNQALYNNLTVPDLQWQNYTPEQESSVGNYDPSMANASAINVDPNDREAQMAALNQMAGLAQSGLGPQDIAAFQQASQMANQTASSGEQAAMQDAEARGMGGSGMSFALGEQARQNAAQQQQNAGMQQAASAANQRALYNQAYLSGAQNLQGQDYNTAAANSNILNQFNMANTQNTNAAKQYNLQNQQGIANQNVAQNNQAQQYNQQGRIGLQQQNYQNQFSKVQGQTGANQGMANTYAAEGAANQANRNALAGAGVQLATASMNQKPKPDPNAATTASTGGGGYQNVA